MSDFHFDRAGYLRLRGLPSLPPPTPAGLIELHRSHCFAIPFENIDPLLGRPVPLDLPSLQEKFLGLGRGGYCFEQNTFFAAVLAEAGFSSTPALGRVWMGRPEPGGRTHLVNLVHLDGQLWLADVGFGGPGLVEAIPYKAGFSGEQGGRRIRLEADPHWGVLYQDFFEGAWRTIYSVANEATQAVDITQGNHYCATHRDSIFTNHLYCSLPRVDGRRTTVYDRSLVERKPMVDAGSTNRWLDSQASLQLLFGHAIPLRLSEADVAAIHAKLPPRES